MSLSFFYSLFFLSLFALNGSLEASVSGSGKLISQTVGSAGNRYVTSREVLGHYLIDKIFSGAPLKNGLEVLDINDKQFLSEVNAVLFEIMLSLESDSFAFSTVKSSDVQHDLDKLKKALKSKDVFAKYEFSDVELERWVRQNKVAKNFLEFKTESMKSNISEAEALNYYEKNKVKFGNVKFEVIKQNLLTFLNKEQLQERLKSYFEVIKRKYKARNTLSEINGI